MGIRQKEEKIMSTKDKATVEKTLERTETLQKYVSDMIAVEEHIGSAVKRQSKDENANKHNPQASRLINNIVQMTERHEQALKQHLSYLGGDAAKGIKEVATAALGTLAGLYDKVRTEPVSKMLRDDYTALNLATIGYTMLHTTGLALNDQATADLALRHLREYTSIVMEINQIIPSIVVAELRDDGGVINESVVQDAVANTQTAWQPSSNGNINNANSAAPKAGAPANKRTPVSRKRAEGESDSADILVASETTSTGRKSSSNGPSTSAPSATTRKRTAAADKTSEDSETTPTTSTKRAPSARKSSANESNTQAS
jgi:hypothetical protein